MLIPHRYPLHKLFTSNIFMASKPFLKFSLFTVLPTTPSSQTHLFNTKRFILSIFPSKPISKIHPLSLKNHVFSSVSDANIHTPGFSPLNPHCKGWDSGEKSLSLFITANGNSALWTCFRAKCGWRGNTGAYVNGNSTSERIAHIPKVKQTREITEKSLDLEPPCNELRAYFAERMTSGETLRRNAVMQRRFGDQVHKILN